MDRDLLNITKEILFTFETKYDPYRVGLKSLNFPTWVLVREDLFNYINCIIQNNLKLNSNRKPHFKQKYKNFRYYTKRCKDYFKKKSFLNKNIDVLFFSNSAFRRGTPSSPYANGFIDGILDELAAKQIDFFVIEYPTFTDFDGRYFQSKHYNRIIPIDPFLPIGVARNSINKLFLYKVVEREIKAVFKDKPIQSLYNEINDKHLIEYVQPLWISRTISFISWKKTFENFIRNLNPKVIIDIAGAGRFAKSILSESTKYFEIQHGIIHPFHVGYIYPSLNSIKHFNDQKNLMVYGDYYKDLLMSKSIFNIKNVITTGNPLYADIRETISESIYEKLNISKNKKIILFTSQFLSEIQEILSAFIVELCSKLPEEYVIVLKLHPRESINEDKYRKLVDFKNVIITKEDPSLHDLLRQSYIHVSVCSTVLLEAILFDLPNIMIKSNFSSMISHIVKDIPTVESVDSFLNLLNDVNFLSKSKEKQRELKYNLFGNYETSNSYIAQIVCKYINAT